MKKFLAIIAMMVTMLCGSIMLVSCSNNYKKMYLVVEYALPGEDGRETWNVVDLNKGFDYTIEGNNPYLYMRVRVEGTSKKVDSLYISQSVNTSTFIEPTEVSPNEIIRVVVKNTGSVKFTITPSQGGADKVVSFNVNFYKRVESIHQNPKCIPALVSGGYIELNKLTNLITYDPLGQTNQTGVNFTITGIGMLVGSDTDLLDRTFTNFGTPTDDDYLGKNVISEYTLNSDRVALENIGGNLYLIAERIGGGEYSLTRENNVVELTASSVWNDKLGLQGDDRIEDCKVYIYLVENVKDFSNNPLLVSYNDNEVDIYKDSQGSVGDSVTNDESVRMEVGDSITLYNSSADASVVDQDFSASRLYVYMNRSIYSYESNPGFKLYAYINGERYDYYDIPDDEYGIQISAITGVSEITGVEQLLGLKFAVNPNSISNATSYKIRLEIDFNAFDFSASDKNPETYLCREFTINIKSLPSSLNVNGKSYQDNHSAIERDIPYLTSVNSSEKAKLFTSYANNKGMPLQVQATPLGAQNSTVYMGVYGSYNAANGTFANNYVVNGRIQLLDRFGVSVNIAEGGNEFEIDTNHQTSIKQDPLTMYLRFNPSATISSVDELYVVYRVLCTPAKFGQGSIDPQYITFVSKIKVVGAIDEIKICKDEACQTLFTEELVECNVEQQLYLDFSTTAMYLDLSEVLITSKNKTIKFRTSSGSLVTELTADKLDEREGNIKRLSFKSENKGDDIIEITSSNDVSTTLPLKFVNVSNASDVKVLTEDPDIWSYNTTDALKYQEEVDGQIVEHDVQLKYLAIQSSGVAQFVAYGTNNKSSNVKSLSVKNLRYVDNEYYGIKDLGGNSYYTPTSEFNSSAVIVSTYRGENDESAVFDITANTIGRTSILFVKVDFYCRVGGTIQLQSKYFIFEVAVYTPARDLRVTEIDGKDNIIYVNEKYLDVAQLNFNISYNTASRAATRKIYFSSSEVNNSIQNLYGAQDNFSNKSIYGIKVDISDFEIDKFRIDGLNTYNDGYYLNPEPISGNVYLRVTASKNLSGVDSVVISFKVVQFGEEKDVTEIKYVIKVGNYNPTETITIESGVQLYNNVYLSLLKDELKTTSIVAYATNSADNATYTELGYAIKVKDGDNYRDYNDSDFKVAYDEDTHTFTLTADSFGGVYELIIFAMDSISSDPQDSEKLIYGVSKSVKVTVSDGLSDQTAYLIKDISEFVELSANTTATFYKLSNDIDLSILSKEGEELASMPEKDKALYNKWWNANRTFEGTLNGQMVIEDLNRDTTMVRNYALKNFVASQTKELDSEDNIGLFTSLSSDAVIKNVIFQNVGLKLTVGQILCNTANIGIVTAVNNGLIKDCSIVIDSSSVQIKNEGDTNIDTINLGLVAGVNYGTILYQAKANNSIYSNLVDCNSAGLTVSIDSGITSATINIGGVAGINANIIRSTYTDDADISVRELVNAVVDIVVTNNSTTSTVNLGGLVGSNKTATITNTDGQGNETQTTLSGKIEKITVTGSLKVSGIANAGGIVGQNATTITEVVNLGTDIEGLSNNQNIGGIIGYNTSAIVDNVRVMFIIFDRGEVAVTYASAQISGYGNVGGIIGKTADVQLTRAYVENFITGDPIYDNIIGKGEAKVAGLIADVAGDTTVVSAILCFVQANIDTNDDAEYSLFGTTPKYSYFNGTVDGVDTVEYYTTEKVDDENIDALASNTTFTSVSVEPIGTITQLYIKWLKNDNVNGDRPYLVYRLTPATEADSSYNNTLTIIPQEIIVNVDNEYFSNEVIPDKFVVLKEEPENWNTNWQDYYQKSGDEYVRLTGTCPTFVSNEYFKKDNTFFNIVNDGIYMQYGDGDTVAATAIVYYDEANNVHKLVTDNENKGLVEKTIIPSIADGDYSVSIIEGGSIATLISSNNTIQFSGVGRVVLRFVSIYNREASDTVVIYVENPLQTGVFDITTSAGIKKVDAGYTTKVDTNSLLGIKLKGDSTNGFDDSKVYMKAEVIETKSGSNVLTGVNYLTISGTTNAVAGGFALGQLQLTTADSGDGEGLIPKETPNITVKVRLSVYLNLAKYKMYTAEGDKLLSSLMNTEALLESRDIVITIYNKAVDLTVPSNNNIKAEAGVAVDISTNLITGYIQGCETYTEIGKHVGSGEPTGEVYTVNGSILELITNNHDAVKYELTALNANAQNLSKQATSSIWDLFNIFITHKQIDGGYNYKLHLTLKDENRLLDFSNQPEKEWRFKVKISAIDNKDLFKEVQFAYVPQQLNGLRIENYSHLVAKNEAEDVVAEFVSNQSESSLIVPGESGLIKIFAEYNYSYLEQIRISSSKQIINGKTYYVKFQQMVYNKSTQRYQSLAGVTLEDTTLTLTKRTYSDGSYDGTIFVRTILESFVGERRSFTITVDAVTYDINMNQIAVTRDKTVISQYRPGVYINVKDSLEDEYVIEEGGQVVGRQTVHLIEMGKEAATVEALLYGYEYNVQPIPTILKLKDGGTWSNPADWVTVNDGSVTLTQQMGVETNSGGGVIIKYLLYVTMEQPFKIQFDVSLIDNGSNLISKSETLLFCAVPFIPKSVSLAGIANNSLVVRVNTSRSLNLTWNTMAGSLAEDSAKKVEIDTAIRESGVSILDMLYINTGDGKHYFSEFEPGYGGTDDGKSFLIVGSDNNYIIKSIMQGNYTVRFNLWYRYEFIKEGNKLQEVRVVFSTTQDDHLLSFAFNLNLKLQTTEDSPDQIQSAEDLMNMGEGANGILTNDIDIDLSSWKPLTNEIASLDGNGKVITFKGVNLNVAVKQGTVNAGLLFETIGINTILKNIVINISGIQDDDKDSIYINDESIQETSINFGLLAGENNGLIYNCEIISLGGIKTIELIVGKKYDLTFGGLVGVNNGNITNSRVGTEYFEQITPDGDSYAYTRKSCYPINLRSTGRIGGLVGENSNGATISSSFVANTSIENHSTIGDTSKTRTAGFVASNMGTIAYSYVKGVERTILNTHLRTTEGIVLASGAGSVAGFAYYNSGTIHDCYSNIQCKSISSAVAGFVYDTSSSQSKVYQCYSASKVESQADTTLATELPFIGVGIDKNNAQQLLSSANVLSCYYLDDGADYDNNYILDSQDAQPKGLSQAGFLDIRNLNNFAFATNATLDQRLNAVWTTSTAVDKNRSTYALGSTILPELTSANQIARSVRKLVKDGQGSDLNIYEPVTDYESGTKNNPHIIRSADEYSKVFVDGAIKVGNNDTFAEYVRFIDNIDFGTKIGDTVSYIEIGTRDKYILGDTATGDADTNRVLTVIDGNGMTISNIAINYASEEKEASLGLFGEVSYSIIKGLNLEYGDNGGSTTATYVGGVAGKAHDTYFIDLNLTSGVELRGHNIVGGVVGKLTGALSGLLNISSNLSALSGGGLGLSYDSQDENKDNKISYAGGIVAVIDTGEQEAYIANLTVDGANISAQHAGGVAGYIGKEIEARRLTYYITSDSTIDGSEVAGGLVADNYAKIELSQVNSRNLDDQYKYDQHFGKYINSEDITITDEEGTEITGPQEINKKDKNYGNLSAVIGDKIIGGFIGINNGADIINSLTKANISHKHNSTTNSGGDSAYIAYEWDADTVIGGFVGQTYCGNYSNVYAQNYIELNYVDNDTSTKYAGIVGGLIGKASIIDSSNKAYGINNSVALNFFDKTQVEKIKTGLVANQIVNYVVGKSDNGAFNCLNNPATTTANSAVVFYGVFNASEENEHAYKNDLITRGDLNNAQSVNMQNLYKDGHSEQIDIFNILFASWDSSVWEKIYTRYTPNLIPDSSNDYYQIWNETDIAQMENDPDGHFILMTDVTINNKTNYVVVNTFKGTLFGTKVLKDTDDPEAGTRDTRFYVNLNPVCGVETGAGFFKQTDGAQIGNIEFVYYEVTLSEGSGKIYDHFSGVSANDTDSRFEQIKVSQETDTTITTAAGVSIASAGSIVSNSIRSEILACNSELDFVLTAGSSATIGGLVGAINGAKVITDGAEGKTSVAGLISGCGFNGSLTIDCTSGGASVAGVVGKTEYTRISSVTVGSIAIEGTGDSRAANETPVEIKVKGGNNNIGGIVGYNATSTVGDCGAYITVDIENSGTLGTHVIGGIIANAVSVPTDEEIITNSNAKLNISAQEGTQTVVAGGIIGQVNGIIAMSSVASQLVIAKDASKTVSAILGGLVGMINQTANCKLTVKDAVAMIEVAPTYSEMLIGGGIVGLASGEYSLTNVASMGYIHAYGPESAVASLTVLGGLVGLAGTYKDTAIDSSDSPVGIIESSYTALTLSTAGVYRGDINIVHTGGIIGYANNKNINLKVSEDSGMVEVVYSSDYTLALEEHDVFKSNYPINVTANVLTTDLSTADPGAKVYFRNWTRGKISGSTKSGLPMPPNTASQLEALCIWEVDSAITDRTEYLFVQGEGKPYSPIEIVNTTAGAGDFGDDYNYYLITSDVTAIYAATKNFKGVLLGNNTSITNVNESLFKGITKHSAITNLNITLNVSGDAFYKTSAICASSGDKNEGTIFMVGVNCNNITPDGIFTGIASKNYGVISNCYLYGSVAFATQPNPDTVAGLAATNEASAVIIDSYFTGVLNTSEDEDKINVGSGIVCKNSGYIANTYTGGQSQYIIEIESEGRYSKVFYDYYATFVAASGEENKVDGLQSVDDLPEGIEGKKTEEIQKNEDYTSMLFVDDGLINNWEVFSMLNWDELAKKEITVDEQTGKEYWAGGNHEAVKTTYNYGYPVKRIVQECYDQAIVPVPSIRGKKTGDGTFNVINSNATALGQKVEHKDGDTVISTFDSNPFLISNLGVLSLINAIEAVTDEQTGYKTSSGTKGKYFALEGDITMFNPDYAENLQGGDDKGILANGPQIGSRSNPFEGVFTSAVTADQATYEFDPTLVSYFATGEELIYDNNSLIKIAVDDLKTISNVNGDAIFKVVGNNAVIANIKLRGIRTKAAPLINTVGGIDINQDNIVDEGTVESTIYNVKISAVSSGGTDIAGYVYSVASSATLNFIKVESNLAITSSATTTSGIVVSNSGTINVVDSFAGTTINVSGATTNIAGFVGTNAGTINTGNMSIEVAAEIGGENATFAGFVGTNTGTIYVGTTALKVSATLSADATTISSFSGFVTGNSGTILDVPPSSQTSITSTSTSATVNISLNKDGDEDMRICKLAGLVETMIGGQISNIDVNFESMSKVITRFFGGAVVNMGGGVIGTAQDQQPSQDIVAAVAETAATVAVKISGNITGKLDANIPGKGVSGTNAAFGGIVANASGGTIKDVDICVTVEIEGLKDNGNTGDYAHGYIIGRYAALTEINYSLSGSPEFKVIDGSNVGGIVGVASGNAFKFTKEAPSSVNVYGSGNVGGFIGLYVAGSGLKLEGDNTWPISGNNYANVKDVARSGNNDSVTFENFGGLIGYWKSSGKINENHEIVNANQVLNQQLNEAFKIKRLGQSNKLINNVGGVVGKYESTTIDLKSIQNSAQIGCKPNFDNTTLANPIQGVGSGVLYSMYQINNVGGLFGLITTQDESKKQPIDCITNNPSFILRNCESTGGVYGMNDVGGLIGKSDINIMLNAHTSAPQPETSTYQTSISTQEEVSNEKNVVMGVFDVGGLIGYSALVTMITATVDSGTYTPPLESIYTVENVDVIGLINVGGFVGWANDLHINKAQVGHDPTKDTTPASIQDTTPTADQKAVTIKGNMYVGGVAGYVAKAEFNDITVTTSTVICGTVFGFDKSTNTTIYYLPTNIGGVSGYISSTHTIIDGQSGTNKHVPAKKGSSDMMIQSVKMYAKVCTDENYGLNGSGDSSIGKTVQVNMNTNYYATIINGNENNGIEKNMSDYFEQSASMYDSITSGIGGFAGGIDATCDDTAKEGSRTILGNGNTVLGQVYAPYGINVGGVFGYVAGNASNVNIPTMNDGAKVAGKVFVGAFIGKCGSIQDLKVPNSSVSVQQYVDSSSKSQVMAGYCIGGVIGYVTGTINGLELDVGIKIKVFNESSSHVGALVGRVDGSVENCSIDPALCDAVPASTKDYEYHYVAEYGTVDGIIQSPTVYNYGGIAGMVSTSGDITIKGKHYYAFTVENLQTSSFNTSTFDTSYTKEEYNILALLAHYVSSAKIEISFSALTELYDGKADKNPINNGRGWAKEYTLFKIISAVHEQGPLSGTGIGNSYQAIYNAEYVNEVGSSGYEEKKGTVEGVEKTLYKYNKDIVYTIYQPLGQIAKLYCAQGVATDAGTTAPVETSTTQEIKEGSTGTGIFIGSKAVNYAEVIPTDKTKFNNIKQHFDMEWLPADAGFDRVSAMIALKLLTVGGDVGNFHYSGIEDKVWEKLHINLYRTEMKDPGQKEAICGNNIPYTSTTDGSNKYYTLGYTYITTSTLKGYNPDSGNYVDGKEHYFAFTTVYTESVPSYTIENDKVVVNKKEYTIYSAKSTKKNAEGQEYLDEDVIYSSGTSGSIFTVNGKINQPSIANNSDVIVLNWGQRWGYNIKKCWNNWNKGDSIWAGVVNVIWGIGKIIYTCTGYWITSLFGGDTYYGISSATIAQNKFNIDNPSVGALFQTKVAGMRSISNLYDALGYGATGNAGALSGAYAKHIKKDGKTILPTSDDTVLLVVDVYANADRTGKLSNQIVVPYMACGSDSTIPNDYDKLCKLEAKYVNDPSYENKYVPKYMRYNDELYLYVGSTDDLEKQLRPNFSSINWGEKLDIKYYKENCDYIDIGGYAYVADNVDKGNIRSDKITNADTVKFVEEQYRVQASVNRDVKYDLSTTATSGEGKYKASVIGPFNIYWNVVGKGTTDDDDPSDGVVTLKFAESDTPPGSGKYITEGEKYYTLDSSGTVLYTLTCIDSSNKLLTSGTFEPADMPTDIAKYKYLVYNDPDGKILYTVKYILYYPNQGTDAAYTYIEAGFNDIDPEGYIGKTLLSIEAYTDEDCKSAVSKENEKTVTVGYKIIKNVTFKFVTKDGVIDTIYKKAPIYQYEAETCPHETKCEGTCNYNRFHYTSVSKISTNNINIGAYSKYGYKSTDGYVLYTRFYYDENDNFWKTVPKGDVGSSNNMDIREIVKTVSDLVIAEGVRFTISNVTPHDPLK